MSLGRWDERFRDRDTPGAPDPLVVETVKGLAPGRALDLACGLGRNSIYLSGIGWDVTAVDGSQTAIERLSRAEPAIRTCVADLEKGQFAIQVGAWDLILCCLYFQSNLFDSLKQGLRSDGIAIATALMIEPGRQGSPYRVGSGQLESHFREWRILHTAEIHHATHSIAEIVARKPLQSE